MRGRGAWRFPAEWEGQDAILIAWPHAQTDWAPNLEHVETTYARLASAVSQVQSLLVVVNDAKLKRHARSVLQNAGTRLDRTRFVEAAYDDTWLRDSGPITLLRQTGVRREFLMLDFRFTGWGGKFGCDADDRLIGRLFAKRAFKDASHLRVDWALEGGAIETDGVGTVLTTLRCLRQRHPHLSVGELRETLSHRLFADRVHVLIHGYLEGDDTDAHIDTLARFAEPSHIVYQGCDDAQDAHYAELRAMAEELKALRQRDGRPYRLTALPWTRPIYSRGRRLSASYANFLIINGAVLVPQYRDVDADARAMRIFAQAFPGRKVIGIDCRPLIEQNGSLHCITMQLPQGALNGNG